MTNNTQPAADLTVTLPDRVIDTLFQSVGVSTYHPDGDQLDALHAFAHAVVAETLARLPAAPAQPPIGDAVASVYEDGNGRTYVQFDVENSEDIPVGTKLYRGGAPIGDVQLSDEQISELAEEHGLDVESALNFFHDCMATAPESALSAPRERQEPAKVLTDALAEIERLNAIINTPHADDFLKAVSVEAEHQRQRWGAEGDAGKSPADWFWLIGYLGGKALHAHASDNAVKAEHHIITTAAACANWHRNMFGKTDMRPGISSPAPERQWGGK